MKTFHEYVEAIDAHAGFHPSGYDPENCPACANRIQIGDEVAYSRKFLQSIFAHTGDLPHARGVVTDLYPLGGNAELRKNQMPPTIIATIKWGNPEIPPKVNVKNLVKVNRMHLEPV